MKQAARRKAGGFTLTEVLIAIAVLSIAILGTIAAIAFGLRASKVGGQDSVALSINRKVMELILQNQYSPSLTIFTSAGEVKDASGFTAARNSPDWHPLYSSGTNGAPAGWFQLSDYGYTPGTDDTKRFVMETEGIQLNVKTKAAPSSVPVAYTEYDVDAKHFYEIIVTTRWQDKSRWRWLQTRAFSV